VIPLSMSRRAKRVDQIAVVALVAESGATSRRSTVRMPHGTHVVTSLGTGVRRRDPPIGDFCQKH
jgi:hypothetical protein